MQVGQAVGALVGALREEGALFACDPLLRTHRRLPSPRRDETAPSPPSRPPHLTSDRDPSYAIEVGEKNSKSKASNRSVHFENPKAHPHKVTNEVYSERRHGVRV